jgi:hypothetical protein
LRYGEGLGIVAGALAWPGDELLQRIPKQNDPAGDERPSTTSSSDRQRCIQNRMLIRIINLSALGWASTSGRIYGGARRTAACPQSRKRAVFPPRPFICRVGQTLEKLKRPEEALAAYCKRVGLLKLRTACQSGAGF